MTTGRTKRPRVARSSLTAIAMLLAASGIIRFGTGPAAAIAREVSSGTSGSEVALLPAGCKTSEDVALALTALDERSLQLDKREADLNTRAALIEDAEAAMNETLAEMKAAETALNATLAIASTAAENDISRLTAVYETMKPREAAALFAEMDPQFAAGFLGRMRPDAAAAVMAGLDPQDAYTISVVLAARNARAPTE